MDSLRANDDGRDGVILGARANQPLTAISNYSLGAVSRMKDGGVSNDELLPALEKTAGQRNEPTASFDAFVNSSNVPGGAPQKSRIVEDAIGFADIEAAKKGTIHTDVQARTPAARRRSDIDRATVTESLKRRRRCDGSGCCAQDRSGRSAAGRYGRVFGDRSRLGRFGTAAGESVPTVLQYQIGRDGDGLNICRSIVEFVWTSDRRTQSRRRRDLRIHTSAGGIERS